LSFTVTEYHLSFLSAVLELRLERFAGDARGTTRTKHRLTDHISRKALEARGQKAFRESVNLAAVMLKDAFQADYFVVGGGNAKKLKELPEGCRRGGNHNAYFGGLRMWEDASKMVSVPTLTIVPPPVETANSA
jgi:hypothetical protein